MSTWLIVDSHNLAWCSHHALEGLTHRGKSTSVLFGYLRDVIAFRDRFHADNVVHCFDKGKSLRKKLFPGYKPFHEQGTLDEFRLLELRSVREQLSILEEALPAVGFKNILSQEGYEADDLIASVCHDSILRGDEAVILSSDRDLLQLLSGQVSIWNRRKHVTLQSFHAEWDLSPDQWADVKALAGCKSDGIKGVKGIGEKTAAKFLRNQLKPGKSLDKIRKGTEVWSQNLQLVGLPWPGVKPVFLHDDEPDPEAWDRLCKQHGLDSLIGMLSSKRGMVGQKRCPSCRGTGGCYVWCTGR